MRRSGRRRILAGAAVLAVLLAVAWFGDAGSAIPIDAFGTLGTEPVLQPPQAALQLVERALAPTGGIPHDAVLTRFDPAAYDSMLAHDQAHIVSGGGYRLLFEPSGAIMPSDRIDALVGTDTVRTCLDGGTLASAYGSQRPEPSCRHYRITFPLRVISLQRRWRPRPLRVVARGFDAWFAPQFAAPESVEEGCGGRDIGAFRRAVAAATIPFAPKGNVDIPALWERAVQAASDGHGVLAKWEPPYPVVHFPGHTVGSRRETEISEAIVLDVPVFGDWPARLVLVRAPRPIEKLLVGAFETTNDEPVCPPARITTATPPPAVVPVWDTLVRIARAQAEDELRRLAFRGSTLDSRVVRAEHHAGATSTIEVEAWGERSRWRGRFTIDERAPEFREAEFVRLAG